MVKIQSVPIAELLEDLSIYPRHTIDSMHVQSLASALEANCEFPPIIVESKSNRIVDGWHRVRAARRVNGENSSIMCELRDYEKESDLLEDAIRLNASHGRRLDRMDMTRSILMLERHNVSTPRIAVVLNITAEKVETLRIKVATSKATVEATVPGTRMIVLKNPVSHMAGKKLTTEQAKAHDSMPGTSFLLLVTQLQRAMDTELINREDEKLMTALQELLTSINKFLSLGNKVKAA